jgi:ribosomal protein S18 acetylase RimI-like enzyme
MSETVRIVAFDDLHADGIAAICEREGWPTFADASRVRTLSTAPGVVALTAIEAGGNVVGAAHVLTDGYHAYLNSLIVAPDQRGRGVGLLLIETAFAESGAVRMDLLSSPDSEGFYAKQPNRTFAGFRLYPPDQRRTAERAEASS